MIWAIIVGGLIGLIAGGITKKGDSMGIIANIIDRFSRFICWTITFRCIGT